jgi:parvulin-like peptidyl-prolyl isomerase
MRRRFLLILLLAFPVGCTKSPEEPAVAKVNGEIITAGAFRERYQSYLESVGGRDNILLRKKILENMINESLIAADIHRRGLDSDAAARSAIEDVRTRQMLLAYAQRITLDTMQVSEADLAEEFRRYQTRVNARYLYAATEDSARKLKAALDRGRTFEELARNVFSDPGLAGNGGSLGFFGWGELDPEIEHRGFTLPLGEVSEPFRFERGYAVLRVDNRVMKPLASAYDFAKAKPELLQAIQKRRILADLTRETEKLKAELAPAVDESAAAEAFAFWKSHGGADQPPGAEVSSGDEHLLGKKLLRAGGRDVSVEDFFRNAAAASAKERARIRSARTLADFAVGLAVRDETLRRARSAGVESDTAVQGQIAQMTRDYLLRRWKQGVEDSVRKSALPEELLRKRFQENQSAYMHAPEVNVAEILLRTKAEAETAARSVRAGKNFSDVAKAQSIRLWAAKRGGELGYAPQSAYGALGEKFIAAPAGAILGPEYVDPYFGVFKILGRREARPMTFDEAQASITGELEAPRIQEALRQSLGRLRSPAAITVDEEILANVVLHQ